MTNINLRLYGEQIYPNISNYLSKYISPKIQKDEFITMYKSGNLDLKEISLKELFSVHPQIKINEAYISSIKINIPDEKENFGISINDIKCQLTIFDIKENEIEKLLIEEKKKLIDEFINYAVKKIQKKDGASFLDNLIKSVIEKIINGLSINIEKLELKIKSIKSDNVFFIFFIEDFQYAFDKGLNINNINLIYQESEIKINVIEKFNITIDIKSSEEKEMPNKINVNISDAIINLNKNIFIELSKILDILEETFYNKIYLKYKKLILFHKPKGGQNEKKDYKSLWFFAIKTVIKLQKYIGYHKQNIFDLTSSSQIKIIEKYLKNNNIIENILLSENNNALKATKKEVEKKILNDKNSNVLANAFSFFFGSKKEEKNNELTEEEKQIIEDIYNDDNISKYLNQEIVNSSNNFNIIFAKVKQFLSNISFNFEISKLQLNLKNENYLYDMNFYINSLKLNSEYIEKQFDLKLIIDDTGYKNNKSFFNKKIEQNAIEISRDKQGLIELKFGFDNVEIKAEEFIGMFIFLNSTKRKKKQKIFYEKINKYQEKKSKDFLNQIINIIQNFSFTNNIKITNIPSLSILTKNNKIELNLSNYSLNENSISFQININDSFGKILNDLSINIYKKDNCIFLALDSPLEINLQNETLSTIIIYYSEYIKEISKYNKNDNNTQILENDDKLFEFNFISYKIIDFGKLIIYDYILDISIKKIEFKLYKEKTILENYFLLDEIKFIYEKKNLNISFNSFITTIDINSNIFYLLYPSEKQLIEKDNNFKEELLIETKINYENLLKNVLNKFNFDVKQINIIINSSEISLSLNSNNINIYTSEESKNINLLIDSWRIKNISLNSHNDKDIIKSESKTILKFDILSNFIKVDLDSINSNEDFGVLKKIYENMEFLFKDKNRDKFSIKNKELYIIEFNLNNYNYVLFDKYNLYLSKINICNYDDKDNISSIYSIKIQESIINNNNQKNIFFSKQIILKYDSSSKNDNKIYLECCELTLNISKRDFSYFYNILKPKQKPKFNKFHSVVLDKDNINNKSLFFSKIQSSDEIEKSENEFKDKNSIVILPNIKTKKLNINIWFEKIDINLYKIDNNEQIVKLLMNSLKIKNTILLNDELLFTNNFNFEVLVGSLDLIYFDEKSEKISILEKRKEVENENQIEIKYGNNNCEIIINYNVIDIRIDSFLNIYYYFQGKNSLNSSYDSFNDIFDIKKSFKLSFKDSKFKLNTSFEGKEILFLDINHFIINYNNMKCKFPFGNYDLFFDRLSSNIILKKNSRKFFQTGEKFLKINLNYYEKYISPNIEISDLLINLSYRDFVSFLAVYELNLQLIDSSMKNVECDSEVEEMKEIPLQEKQTAKGNIPVLTGEMTFKNINITLIDDSKGSYQPFLNFIFENFRLTFLPDNSFSSKFSFIFSTYNYIACIWEPVIEKMFINSNGIYRNNYEINIGIDNLLMNFSDMAISFTLIIFNDWLTKLEIKTKKYENKEMKLNSKQNKKEVEKLKNTTKITNNQIINYTGIKLNFIHNEKQISCLPLEKIELDNSNLNEIEGINKQNYITLLYDKQHKFEIPLGKIISLKHSINDKLFIISENSLSKDKTINISLYSPYIFKNKTTVSIKILITNKIFGSIEIILNPNSICGLPLNILISSSKICFILKDSKRYNENNIANSFSLDEIFNSKKFKKNIYFSDKTYTMELVKKFKLIKTLVIYSEYNIVNCLPCYILVDYFKKKNLIEKCTQHHITENFVNNLFIQLTINTEIGSFTTERIDLLDFYYQLKDKNAINKSISFKNEELGKKFELNSTFKIIEEEKVFIIYSELILFNRSGLNISINDIDTNHFSCLSIDEKINLIASNINYQEEKIKFRCNNYLSKEIKIDEIIQITNNISIPMFDNQSKKPFDLIIKKKLSYVKIKNNENFGENIISIVFAIYPMCRIFNLLSNKKFLVFDSKEINKKSSFIVKPFESVNFKFFNKGYEHSLCVTAIDEKEENFKLLSKLRFKIGIYTLITNDFFYNLDIKKNPTSGCLDVYVLENNINNSQTILENLSDETITIYQINYEQKLQILKPNDISPLQIYDYTNKKFVFLLNDKIKEINIGEIKNCQKNYRLNNKISVIIQDNEIKMKITFYSNEKYNQVNLSLINLKCNIYIKTIYISIIGDNEIQYSKLAKYDRNELLLIYINNFKINIDIQQTTGLLNKNLIKTKLIFDKINIYNQLSSEGKFPCILKNDDIPCINIENEINYYTDQKIYNFKSQKIEIKKLILGIDPNFIRKLLTFYDDVLSRMDLTYFNVNKVFLDEHENNSKKLINKHIKGRILINANNLLYPKLDIEFQLVEKGLKELLKERIGCSDFYIWIAKGLVGSPQKISIEKSISNYTNGTIDQYFVWLYYKYLALIEEHISKIGLKGFFGQISSFVNLDLLNEKQKDKNFKKNRIREPRQFYGKFKFYKEYDKDDVFLIKNTFEQNKVEMKEYYPTKIIKEKNLFYLFTNISIFYIESLFFTLQWKLDYHSIKTAVYNDNVVNVIYNYNINKNEKFVIKCENSEIAKLVAETINEESLKNKENINEL